MIDIRTNLDKVPAFNPSEVVGCRNRVANDIANPIRLGNARHTLHSELCEALRPCVTQVSIGNPKSIVPILGQALVAGPNVRAIKRQAEFIHLCRAEIEAIRSLHVLVERFGVRVAILEELVHVGGIVVGRIQHRVTEKDPVAAGTIEVQAAISLVRRLIVVA